MRCLRWPRSDSITIKDWISSKVRGINFAAWSLTSITLHSSLSSCNVLYKCISIIFILLTGLTRTRSGQSLKKNWRAVAQDEVKSKTASFAFALDSTLFIKIKVRLPPYQNPNYVLNDLLVDHCKPKYPTYSIPGLINLKWWFERCWRPFLAEIIETVVTIDNTI